MGALNAMNIGSDTAGLLVKLLFLAASSFVCLLWAIYVIDVRSNRGGDNQHVTRLDSFVTSIKNRHYTSGKSSSAAIPSTTTAANLPKVTVPPTALHADWRPSDYNGYIFMDWTGDSDDFDYVNYKSMESLLSVYPKANVKVNLIAPNAAHYYKTGNLISKHYFQKYLKHGYHVQTEIIYRKFRVRFDNDTMPPGSEYWNAQYLTCCESSKATEINKIRTIPAHMYFFLRFFKLWAHGGVYSDFSWMHTREMAVVRTLDFSDAAETPLHTVGGAVIQLSCPETSSHSSSGTTDANGGSGGCNSSALLVFSRGNPVLRCMLLQYNSTSTPLMRCIESDVKTDGVSCISDALKECFRVHRVRNALVSSGAEREVPQLGCEGQPAGGTIAPLSVAVNLESMCGLTAVQYQNALFLNPRESTKSAAFRAAVLEEITAAVWLGVSAFSGDWHLPEPDSALAVLIQQHPLKKPGPYYKNVYIDHEGNESALDREPEAEGAGAAADSRGGILPVDSNAIYRPYPVSVLGAITPAESTYLEQLRRGAITLRKVSSASRGTSCKRYNYSSAVLPARMKNQVSMWLLVCVCMPRFMVVFHPLRSLPFQSILFHSVIILCTCFTGKRQLRAALCGPGLHEGRHHLPVQHAHVAPPDAEHPARRHVQGNRLLRRAVHQAHQEEPGLPGIQPHALLPFRRGARGDVLRRRNRVVQLAPRRAGESAGGQSGHQGVVFDP
jgi:hypothetical protein